MTNSRGKKHVVKIEKRNRERQKVRPPEEGGPSRRVAKGQ